DWEPTAGGGSGHIVAKPDDPDIVYGGSYGGFLMRLDHRTGERRLINVWPDNPMGWGAADLTYRFQWNFPLFFSPHDADTLYAAGNVLFASRDEGASWQPLSGDLTRNDASKMGPSGGPITKDNTSVEYYGTIFAALESPHEPGVLWAGTDDGLIQLSRDGGASWSDVTPKELPEWTQINGIDAHPFEPGGLYVAGTRYKLDDFTPYLFKTTDYGASWQRIDTGIDRLHTTRAIRADPDRRGLLYAGTENGVYVSFDDGGQWQSLQLELPVVPITDLAVKEQDLVAATQGRGYWILDDLTVLHQHDPAQAEAPAHLYEPTPAPRWAGRPSRANPVHEGTNPPSGVVFHFFLSDDPYRVAAEGDSEEVAEEVAEDAAEEVAEAPQIQLEILEQGGGVIRTFTPKPPPGKEDDAKPREGEDDPRQLELTAGANRFVWDMRYPGADRFPGLVLWNRNLAGPTAVPGTYRARLTVDDWTGEVPFEIHPDPRSSATADDYQAQFDFLISVRDTLSETHRQIGRLRDARDQIKALGKRLKDSAEDTSAAEGSTADDDESSDEPTGPARLVAAGEELAERLSEIEKALYQTQNRSPQDPLNFPIRLNDKLAGLLGVAGYGDRRPTESMLAVRAELTAAIDDQLAKLEAIWETDLPAYNELARELGVDRVLLEPTPDG
ncbi:MAG: sialidase family protein, partial [Acidobacteriota bacterium]